MTSSDVRFKIELDAENKTFKLTDTYAYDSATGDYVVGVYKLLDSAATVVYKNADYDTPDEIQDPDIVVKSSTSAAILNMPLDSSGNIKSDKYSIGYKVNVPASFTNKTTGVEGVASNTIKATITAGEAAEIVKLGVFEVKGHATAGMNQVYTIQSMSYTGSVATFTVNETVPTASAGSSETITTFAAVDYYEVIKDFTYCLTKPEVDIDYVVDCDTPKLTSSDNTSYAATNNSKSIAASSVTRTHTLTPPVGSGITPITASTSSIVVTNVWTNVWQTTISTDVVWEVEKWSTTDTTIWYYISGTVKGADSADVQCENCGCEINDCFEFLYNKWIAALATNPTEERELREALIKAISNWSMYRQAQSCGDSTTTYCDALKGIFSYYDCTCGEDTDAATKQITGSSTSGLFNKTYVGSGVPNNSIGQDGDIFISDNYKVYEKSSGSWTEKVDLSPTENQRTWQQTVVASLTDGEKCKVNTPLNGSYKLKSIDYCVITTLNVDAEVTFSVDGDFITNTTISKGTPLGINYNIYSTELDVSAYSNIVIDTSSAISTTGKILVTYTFVSK